MANPNHDPKNDEFTSGGGGGSVKNAAQNGINMQKNIRYIPNQRRKYHCSSFIME